MSDDSLWDNPELTKTWLWKVSAFNGYLFTLLLDEQEARHQV